MDEQFNTIELAVEIMTTRLSNPSTRVTLEDVRISLKNSHAALVGMIDPPVEAVSVNEEAPKD